MNVPKLRFKDNNDNDYPNWVNSTIGKSGYFYYGKSAPKWSITDTATTPCVRYGELYTTHNIIVKKIYSYTNIPKENLKFSTGNEVLVPRVGEEPLDFCKCCYLPFKDVAIGEMISVYNTKNNPLFISYMFNGTMKYKFARLVEGGNVSNLYYSYLENISINLPCLEEQKKIANFLSTVDKKITNLENTITSLENQKKGLLQQIFSQKLRFKDKNGNNYPNWKKKKLGDLFTIKAGGDINKENFSEQYSIEFKYPVYANALTNNGLYGYSNIYKIDKPSITVTGRGINVGFALSREPFYYPIVRLLVLIPNININFTFFTESINFIHIFNESTGVPQLTAPQLSKVNVYVPNIEEQNKIGNLFDKLNEKIDNKKAQLEHWQQIKKGLLQQMFV